MSTGVIIGLSVLALLVAVILLDRWVNGKMLTPQEEADKAEEHKTKCLGELEETKRLQETKG